MRFPLRELDITIYLSTIKRLLEEEDCHIFIDTNILGHLFKLNGKARGDLFEWVKNCGDRFHVPVWAVMEYNKKIYGQKLKDYVGELKLAQTIKTELFNLQKFFYGYVDEEKIKNSKYNSIRDFWAELDSVCSMYSRVVSAVASKENEHINQVQKEIDERLKDLVMDTDIYKLIGDLYFEYQLRLDCQVPPGFKDYERKQTNQIGDLIIWQEILHYCKANNVVKAIFVTCDEKPDMSYSPQIQTVDNHPAEPNDKIRMAYESMVYEFKLASGGSEEFYAINLYTLVSLLADKYQELAFSFQMVSRDTSDTKTDDEHLSKHEISEEGLDLSKSEITTEIVYTDSKDERGYSPDALKDVSYMDVCEESKLKPVIEGLRSYNWYYQNDSVSDLRSMLVKAPADLKGTEKYKDDFFVIGRNLLQSAEGNAFESVRFIGSMAGILENWPLPVKQAIVDGCFFEIFFDNKGEIRQRGFKARYVEDVMNQAKALMGDDAFKFINDRLSKVQTRFVPTIGSEKDYNFVFGISKTGGKFDSYQTDSLEINGIESSKSFSNAVGSSFATNDEIKYRLSLYYAVPKEKISISGIPSDLKVLNFIKEEDR